MAAPGGTGPLGPYPAWVGDDDEGHDGYDRLRRRVLWTMPQGLYVIGSTDGAERRNGMTANWVTQVSFDPKLVGVGIQHGAVTRELVAASGAFSVNFVRRDDRALVRKFTKPVDVDLAAGTLNGERFHARTTGAPVLDGAAAFLDCVVREALELGDHTLFVGEVVDSGFLAEEGTDVLRMEDTRMNYGG